MLISLAIIQIPQHFQFLSQFACLTFWVFIIVGDILAGIAAHGLGACVLANRLGLRVDLCFLSRVRVIRPGDAVGIDLCIDERAIVVQVDVSFLDGRQRSWTALEDACRKEREGEPVGILRLKATCKKTVWEGANKTPASRCIENKMKSIQNKLS